MGIVIADCETDGLLDAMTKLHMLQIGDADGDDAAVYCDTVPPDLAEAFPCRPIAEGLQRLSDADAYVFHNGIGFDLDAINRFYPGTIQREKMLDTLVMARLAHPEERLHTLKAWGARTGTFKGEYNGDFSKVDAELLEYAPQDIRAGRALWHAVRHVRDWGTSCQLEHDVAFTIVAQERNGFTFDTKRAEQLYIELRGQLADMERELQVTFPPIARERTFTPKVNRKDLGYIKGVPFTKRWTEPFNPSSHAHIAERLQLLGWKPSAFGANGVPTTDEKTLAPLPWPAAKVLLRYLKLLKQIGQLADGKQGWLKAVKADGRIHGRVNPNGAVTGRMSHFSPNVAQADKDPRMRGLWIPRPGCKLVGCDAEGIEARMLAHYLFRWDDGAFAERVLNGVSADRTDVHSANLKAMIKAKLLPMECWKDPGLFKIARGGSGSIKAILYALMYGAGDFKLGETLKAIWRDLGMEPPQVPNKELGRLVRMALARSMVGLDKLVEAIGERAKTRGYLIGLDGRHLFVRSPHAALNTLLQGGGAIVMKVALQLLMQKHGRSHGKSWGLVANVHDEIQSEAEEDFLGWPEQLGQCVADCIRDAGVLLQVRCPLAGAFKVGNNWSETH